MLAQRNAHGLLVERPHRLDDGNHRLAEIWMRHADHCGFGDIGPVVEHRLDLCWIDVEPARNDQILLAPDQLDRTVRIDKAHVAGDEIPIGPEFRSRFLRHLPIALEDVRPPHLDDADLALL